MGVNISHSKSRWLKRALLAALPIALLWKIASMASWRPRVVAVEGDPIFSPDQSGRLQPVKPPRNWQHGGEGRIGAFAYSPDGRRLALGREVVVSGHDARGTWAYGAGQVQLWDAASYQPRDVVPFLLDPKGSKWGGTGRRIEKIAAGPVRALVFSPDGKHLLVSDTYESMALLDVTTKRWIFSRPQASLNRCYPVGFSSDSRSAFYAEWKNFDSLSLEVAEARKVFVGARLVEVSASTGSIIKTTPLNLRGEWPLRFVQVSGSTIACATILGHESGGFEIDNKIILFDQRTGQRLQTFDLKNKAPMSFHRIADMAVSPHGVMAVTFSSSDASDDNLRLLSLRDGHLLSHTSSGADYVTQVAFSPDGTLLAGKCDDSTIGLWNGFNGNFLRMIGTNAKGVSQMLFSPDGNTLAAATGTSNLKFWRVK